MTFPDFVALARQFVIRAFTADFQREQASPSERAELLTGTRPIADPLAHDYVAWRRAALWVAAVLLSLGVLIALVDYSSTAYQLASASDQGATTEQLRQVELQFGSGNLNLLDGLQIFLLLVKIAVAGLVVFAAMRWTKVQKSRSFTRWAWLSALIIPLLISAWPWGQYLDFSHLNTRNWGGASQQGEFVKQQVSVAIGAMLLVTVAPKLLALFPGIMRSSLALKTLLPQATAPGWLTVVFAPFLAGFLLLALCFMSQVQGSWVLIAGVLCLVVGPCVYVRRASDLVRPHTDAEVGDVVRGVRRQALTFHLVGGLLLFLYFIDLDALPWTTAIHLLLEAAGGILLTMVAISDITLALLAYSHRQGSAFHSSELVTAHEQRLAALSTAGLTDLDAALGIPGTSEATTIVASSPEPPRSMLETMVTAMPRPQLKGRE
tara:strand:- start:1157 stop:2461 length:1305 start_codon:yes stop_codon:yes gene_type:complete